jgi:membrane-associated protease RseP (regulator of RpoE activity)
MNTEYSDPKLVYKKVIVVTFVAAALVLIGVISGVVASNTSKNETNRLRREIASLNKVIDSLDKRVEIDTVKIDSTREVVRVLVKRGEEVKIEVSRMPPNELAQVFRDSSLRYGR